VKDALVALFLYLIGAMVFLGVLFLTTGCSVNYYDRVIVEGDSQVAVGEELQMHKPLDQLPSHIPRFPDRKDAAI